MSIGKRIRARRKELNLTQQDLARALGVTPQHISVIEQDKRAPSLLSLAKLAEELGVTVDYIITGKESVITEAIPAIKADRKLSLQSKRALVSMIEELYRAHGIEPTAVMENRCPNQLGHLNHGCPDYTTHLNFLFQ